MIAYFKGKSLVSKLIKWRTWGEYSHVAWIEADGTIYESWHRKSKGAKRRGVRKGVAGDLHKPGTLVDLYIIQVSDLQHEAGIQCLEDLVADPDAGYDFRGVLSGFTLRKKNAHGRNSIFCSRLMMRFLRRMGKVFLLNIEEYQTSPVDMSHSTDQLCVGTWETGTPLPDFKIPEGWR